MTPEAKATRNRIVRLLRLLGQENPRVVTRKNDDRWEAAFFKGKNGAVYGVTSRHESTEADVLAATEKEVRKAVRSLAKYHREAAEAALNSAKQQLVEVAARLAKADALDRAMKER